MGDLCSVGAVRFLCDHSSRLDSMVRLKEMAFGFPGIPPVPPTYKLFISHAWDREEYDSLVILLQPDTAFRWNNLSVPKQSPIPMSLALPKSIRTLVHELDNRIREADSVLIITGMYVAHRQWIQSEIEAALEFGKPIVGVAPRGQNRIPEAARLAIDKAGGEIVRWNRESIISAIRRHVGLGTPAPVENFFRNPTAPPPSPTLAMSLADLYRNPTAPAPPLENLFRNPTAPPSSPTLANAFENLLRKQQAQPLDAGPSNLSKLLGDITKSWSRK